jgi:hypothetical protein
VTRSAALLAAACFAGACAATAKFEPAPPRALALVSIEAARGADGSGTITLRNASRAHTPWVEGVVLCSEDGAPDADLWRELERSEEARARLRDQPLKPGGEVVLLGLPACLTTPSSRVGIFFKVRSGPSHTYRVLWSNPVGPPAAGA